MTGKWKEVLWYLGLALVVGSASFVLMRSGHDYIGIGVILIPVALIVNGLIAEWEDNQPGGFNNPKPPPK